MVIVPSELRSTPRRRRRGGICTAESARAARGMGVMRTRFARRRMLEVVLDNPSDSPTLAASATASAETGCAVISLEVFCAVSQLPLVYYARWKGNGAGGRHSLRVGRNHLDCDSTETVWCAFRARTLTRVDSACRPRTGAYGQAPTDERLPPGPAMRDLRDLRPAPSHVGHGRSEAAVSLWLRKVS